MTLRESKRLLLCLSAILFIAACSDNTPLSKAKLYKDNKLHEISIELPFDGYWDSLVAAKESRKQTHISKYLIGNLTIDGDHYDSVGVRLKGESSYDYYKGKKKSFKLDLNKVISGQKHGKARKINLINCFKDPTHLREKLYFEALQDQGVPTPRASYANVYLNGIYWGVYMVVEQIDKYWVEDYFGHRNGNLYKGEPDARLAYLGEEIRPYERAYKLKHQGLQVGYTDLQAFTKVIEEEYESDEAFVEALDEVFETDKALKAWAINSFYVNIDAYNMLYPHNFYLFNDSTTGKFNWISFDGNYAFAAWSPKFNLFDCASLDIFWQSERFEKPLVEKIFASPILKRRYADFMYDIVNDFDLDDLGKDCFKYANVYKEALEADTNMMYTYKNARKNIKAHLGDIGDPGAYTPGLVPFMEARVLNVKKQLTAYGYSF